MRWLWFVATLICFAVVFKTPSMGLAVVCLLGALITGLIGVFAVASSRIDSRSRDASTLLGPEELRRVRELEARRRAGAGQAAVVPVAVGGAALAADRAEPARDAAAGDVADFTGGDASDGGGSAD